MADAAGDVETVGKLYECVVARTEEQIEKSCRMYVEPRSKKCSTASWRKCSMCANREGTLRRVGDDALGYRMLRRLSTAEHIVCLYVH